MNAFFLYSKEVGAKSQPMNADGGGIVSTCMSHKTSLTPREKEIQSLLARGKSPEAIAIRLGMKLSKVLMAIAMMPKLL
ncbi:helix-turn-helix transcriptional regulator [Prosthecobacter fluviatilis]|uniref:Helix-turn-helix transcriptional regulator n=1 Tax=Prosthecobacter fluviatilis TaxID=445931 RepID=A0ABW0KYP0_9BACT